MRWLSRLVAFALSAQMIAPVGNMPAVQTGGGGGGGGIAFGASTRLASFATTNSLSGSSPNVSGSNLLAVAKVATENVTGYVSGVTWNGVSMTEDTSARAIQTASGDLRLQIFYLVAPATGVTTVAVSSASNWSNAFVSCEYYTGVNQSTPIDTQATLVPGSSSTSIAPTLTTTGANEYVLDHVWQAGNGITLTIASPAVATQSGGNTFQSWKASYQSQATAGVTTFNWSSTVSGPWAWSAIAIKP